MKIVYLDCSSLGNDLPMELFEQFDDYKGYPTTKPEEVLERIKGATVVVSNKVYIGEEHLKATPTIKLIAVTATGTNNVDINACKKAGVAVLNVVNYSTDVVAQHTFAMILSLSSSLFNYKKTVDNGEWQVSKSFCLMKYPVIELPGKTMGIIGYGAIGKRVAHMARAFGMKVLTLKRPGKLYTDDCFVDLDTLLSQSDVVTIHCPLTEETRNIITFKELYKMKKTAIIINCARGGIISEADLAKALEEDVIAGAGLDVLSVEPPLNGNPLLNLKKGNLIITPHIAWASIEARTRLISETVNNIKMFAEGKLDRNLAQ